MWRMRIYKCDLGYLREIHITLQCGDCFNNWTMSIHHLVFYQNIQDDLYHYLNAICNRFRQIACSHFKRDIFQYELYKLFGVRQRFFMDTDPLQHHRTAVLPNTQEQKVHGNYVSFEEIKETRTVTKKLSLIELLDGFSWGSTPESNLYTTFKRLEFKKRGGIKAIIKEDRYIYRERSAYVEDIFIFNYVDMLPQTQQGNVDKHKPIEPGLHPNAIDAYYSVNDQINRMISSESFKKMREKRHD